MSMSRIGTDGNVPQYLWKQIDLTTSGTPGTAVPLSGTPVITERALVRNNGSANVSLGPTNAASFVKNLPPDSEYLITLADIGRFDISLWYIKSGSASQAIAIAFV